MSSTKDLRRELGRMELLSMALGQVIGAGIMALVGIGIAMTGKSVAIAFILSAVWVILLSIPWVFISSCVRLRGGEYTQACVLVGERFGGIFIVIFFIRNLQMAIYAMAFASYFKSIVPNANETIVTLAVITAFFLLNVYPTKFIAKIQNIILFFLLLALAMFLFFGIPQIQPGYWSGPELFTGGTQGLLAASAILTFATFGASSIFQLSGEAKNPTVDIPIVMVAATLLVAVLYAGVSMVAAGVLPVEQVANENLSVVAQAILSRPLYLFFVIGGALCAIATSLNATIAWVTKPILQACEDGWFPKKLAYLHPKHKTPVYILGVFYIITILPILFGVNMESITNSVLILMYLCMIVTSLATMRIPKLFPEQWAKSPFKVNETVLKILCIIACIVLAVQVYFNMELLDSRYIYVNAALLLICIVYALWRYSTGKVNIEISYEDD